MVCRQDAAGRDRPECSRFAPLAIASTLLFAAAPFAHGQNLVQDPYFANGLPAQGYTDASGSTYYSNAATTTTFDGVTGLDLSASGNGYFEIFPIAGFNPNGVTYVFSFLAAAFSPDAQTQIYGEFGFTIDSPNYHATETVVGSGLTQYTLTGTSSNAGNGAGYLYLSASGAPSDVFVTDLDLQAAPAPVSGSGIVSFAIVLAGLAARRFCRGVPLREHPVTSADRY